MALISAFHMDLKFKKKWKNNDRVREASLSGEFQGWVTKKQAAATHTKDMPG